MNFRLSNRPIWVLAICGLLAVGCSAQSSPASNALDTIVFGDPASRASHQFTADHAETVLGGLDQTAVRLLPLTPASFDGGSVSFVMQVDPRAQNYVSVRLWGSDEGADKGRLVLYANGEEVGYRNQGDYDLLNQCDEEAEAPGRFFFETRPLPLSLTAGKTQVTLKVAALGRMWPYGTTFEKYQKAFTVPSRGIYEIYTHTVPRLQPPAPEVLCSLPTSGIRTSPGPEVIEKSKAIVIARIDKILASPPSAKWDDLYLLPEAYNVPWTPAYHNPAAILRVLHAGDNLAAQFVSDPKFNGDWPGAGPLGEAILRMWPVIGQHMDEPFVGKVTGATRRQAWSYALKRSVDYWRTHRRSYTNQSMLVDGGIYRANRGLQLIDPAQALPEAQALHYLYEAVGLVPWLGNDVLNGGPDSPERYANAYYLVTRKGVSRELGWVGTYGETIMHFTRDFADLTGDEKIRGQLAKLQAARLYFRYPGVDGDGYRCLKMSSEIDTRTAHYPLSGAAYSSGGIRESWWMEVAAELPDDTVAVGAAERSISDGQYFAYVQSRLQDPDTRGMMRNVDQYAKVAALPPAGYHFPMEDGQPDFVFADEEDAVIALKHGDTRLFVNLYFRAENAVNNVAKILEVTPETTRIVTAKTQTQVISSGQTFTRPDYIDSIRGDGLRPPGQDLHQAWAGETLAVSARPAGATYPQYGERGPFVGRAAFYWLTYGDYLIGLNTTETNTYDLPVPDPGRAYNDLVSQKQVQPTAGVIKVPPLSTVVLYLGG